MKEYYTDNHLKCSLLDTIGITVRCKPDLNHAQLSDEALAQHGAMSGLDLLFKHIFDRPTPELLTQLLGSLAHNSGDIQYYALQYMMSRFDIDKQTLLDKALNYLESEKVMTVAEQLKEEGKLEGIEQGIEKEKLTVVHNALKFGAHVEFVAKITGLSLEEVQAIKAALDKK